MTTNEREATGLVGGIAAAHPEPGNQPTTAETGSVKSNPEEPLSPVSRGYIFWLMLASFGASMAMMVPLSYGIALRITELAPGQEEILGYITGTAQLIYLVLSPMVGIWSDRMRSRFGRRTPLIFLGTAIGLAGLVVMGSAPNLLIVGAGWVLGMSGWSISGAAVQNLMADRLPEQQRGRVSALTGLMTQIAPVLGIGIAYAVSSNTLLVFVVPGVIGAVLLALFPLIKPEGSSKDLAPWPRLPPGPCLPATASTCVNTPTLHGTGWAGSCSSWACTSTPRSAHFSTPNGSTFRSGRLPVSSRPSACWA